MFTSWSTYVQFLLAFILALAIGSITLSIIFEFYAYYVKLRAVFLRKLIDDVLNDNKLNYNYAEEFYNQPQIDLTKKTYRHQPAYISSVNFSQALIMTIVRIHETSKERFIHKEGGVFFKREHEEGPIFERFKSAVKQMCYSDLKILLTGFINTADNDREALLKNISIWYDEYMNRASGWYKMKIQKRLAIIAVFLCLLFNVDLFSVSRALLHDKELSVQVASISSRYQPPVPDGQPNETSHRTQLQRSLEEHLATVDYLYWRNAPVGWKAGEWQRLTFRERMQKLLGCAAAGLCLAFGAPFWFELLGALVNLRKAGHKPEPVK